LITALAFVAAAGTGAVARALVARSLEHEHGFPLGTVVVNVTGSVALGLLVGIDAPTLTILGTGLLGAFTTFSSFARDAVALAEQKHWLQATTYLASTCALTVTAAAAGLAISG
jgi:CrcB protein